MLLPVIEEKVWYPAVSLEEVRKHLDVYDFNDDDMCTILMMTICVRF
ncbi:MAG: hypothetical protein JSC189_000732 [Candidatus Tokpelaia sp. JSC189]|nr:MAG: hypothetical protein JSC189_000732 [Candidatus Tokpelaia sp. JSC189]